MDGKHAIGHALLLQPLCKSKPVSPIATLIRYVISQLPQQIYSQPPYRSILDIDREIGWRRDERVKGVAVVNHAHGQVSIAYRQNDDDSVLVSIVVSILDAVGDQL